MQPHLLILEGTDYTGKTTIAELLRQKLVEKQYKAIVVRAPGGSDLGERMRTIARSEADTIEEQYLAYLLALTASKSMIEKYVDEGYVVILDRWVDSLTAYQISKFSTPGQQKLAMETAWMCTNMMMVRQRKAFLLTTSEVIEQRRELHLAGREAKEIKDRFDASPSEYRAKVNDTYHELAENYLARHPASFTVIDAGLPESFVQKQALEYFLQGF